MPFSVTINGTNYTDTDFDSLDTYASKFNQLVGDIYDHISNKYAATSASSVAIGTGAKSFAVNNNLSSANCGFHVGQFVLLRPVGTNGNDKLYMQNFMLGNVTSVAGNTVNVNVTVVRGSGTYAGWYISYLGDTIATNGGTQTLSNGGTGSSAVSTARTNIGFGDPPARGDILFDDFTGYFDPQANGYLWIGEKFQATTLQDPDQPFLAGVNAGTNGYFLQNAQTIYDGDTLSFNTSPFIIPNPNLPPAPPPQTFPQSSWAHRPGVIGLQVWNPGSRVSLQPLTATAYNYLEFPSTGDVLEFAFMFPKGEGFDLDNLGTFCIGTTIGGLAGQGIMFNVGNVYYSPIGFTGGPASVGPLGLPNGAGVEFFSVSPSTSAFYTDNASQTTALTIQEGRWYKVRISRDQCLIYSDGTILYKTINGWTSGAMGVSNGSRLFISLGKTSGGRQVTVLLDYITIRHAVTR